MRIIAIIMLLMQLGNVEYLHRPMYQQPDGSISTVETMQYWCGAADDVDFIFNEEVIIHITPIIEIEDDVIELSDDSLYDYVQSIIDVSSNAEELLRNDWLNLIEWIQPVNSWESAVSVADTYDVMLHLLQEKYYCE